MFTPLQCAVDRDREDIVKALIKAGASPESNYGRHPKLDKKVERMIFHLFHRVKCWESTSFFSLFVLYKGNIRQKFTESIRNISFKSILSFIQFCLSSTLVTLVKVRASQYHQSAIKWLKDTKSRQIH